MSSWGQGGSRPVRRARAAVLDRDAHRCQLQFTDVCVGEATQAHHVESIAAAGLSRREALDPDSMIAVCKPCHDRVTEQQRRQAHIEYTHGRRQRRHKPHPGD